MKRQMETGEPLTALFGDVTDPDIVAKKKRIRKKCIHEKLKCRCRECKPEIICKHGILRYNCRECKSASMKMKRQMQTGEDGSQEHLNLLFGDVTDPDIVAKKKRIRKKCRHEKLKKDCRECTPELICIHEKLKKYCRECGGSAYCECGIHKTRCAKHGGSALCIVCKLIQYNPKYDKHCLDCFVNFYPGDPRSDRNSKLKRRETIVREAIDSVFEGFIHDKAFSTGGCCPHRREIDHRILINGTVLAVETDEKAHVSRDKQDEINRYDDLVVAFGTKFIFIRFNCDTTREERGVKTSLEHKIEGLLSCIRTQITRIRKNENTELCDIVKLFYCKKCSKQGSDICVCPPTS